MALDSDDSEKTRRPYTRLTFEMRQRLEALATPGRSHNVIGEILGIPRSTIYTELLRCEKGKPYCAKYAQKQTEILKKTTKRFRWKKTFIKDAKRICSGLEDSFYATEIQEIRAAVLDALNELKSLIDQVETNVYLKKKYAQVDNINASTNTKETKEKDLGYEEFRQRWKTFFNDEL